MRRIATVTLVVLLAGCAQPPPSPTTSAAPTGATVTETVQARAELPEWSRGQGWTYVVEVPGQPARTFEMMVAEDRGDLWVVASNDRQQAIHHVLYSTNPVLGRIGKATLSPFQGGGPVDMFKFPLTDGKTWSATFFGEQMTFRVAYAGDISLVGADASSGLPKRVDGYRITANGASKRVVYDYVEAVEWFTSFEVFEKDNRQIKLSLRDIETKYTGQYFFYRGASEQDSFIRSFTNAGATAPTPETFDVPVVDKFKDGIAAGVIYTGKAGTPPPSLKLELKNPGGASAWTREFTDARQLDFSGEVAASPASGTWKLDVTKQGTFNAEVRVVGFSKFAEGSL